MDAVHEIISLGVRKADAEWREAAACSGDMGQLFYPPVKTERRSVRAARELRAKLVCAECPVREPCLEQALRTGERYGIWGGLNDIERQRLQTAS